MKNFIYIILSAIMGSILTIIVNNNGDLTAMLEQVQSWYNSNVAIANTGGIFSAVITIALSYFLSKAKQDETATKIVVSSNTEQVESLNSSVNQIATNLNQINLNEQLLADMLVTFARNTKISQSSIDRIIDLYSNVHTTTINVTNQMQTVAQTAIAETKQVIATNQPQVETIISEGKSIFDQLTKDIKG